MPEEGPAALSQPVDPLGAAPDVRPAGPGAPLDVLRVTSAFGFRRHPILGFSRMHQGVDFAAREGTPVLAAADGTVIRVGEQPLAGKFVLVQHATDLTTASYHLSAIAVAVGRAVQRGEALGRSGMTGNATAPHLHFGVCRREDGQCGESIKSGWDDPERYWIADNPCFVAGHAYPAEPVRLTFPLPCLG